MPVFDLISPPLLALAACVALFAGIVKGLVGFAMPMIIVAGMGSFVAPELALAALILPTLVTNVMQALDQGWAVAWRDAKGFLVFMVVGGVCLIVVAQIVPRLDPDVFFVALGVPVVLFSVLQLLGWRPTLDASRPYRVQGAGGLVAGALGGLSGVWGPPTVLMLTALGTEKSVQLRVQGVAFGFGSVLLTLSHLRSGILNEATVWVSAAMIAPAVLGMWLGTRAQGRIDQATFRRLTLIVLIVAGANLIRRGLFG